MYQKQPPEVFCKKCVLKNVAYFTRKHLCWSLFLKKLQDFRHTETPTQVLYRTICKISKNSYFEEHLQATASGVFKILSNIYLTLLNVFFYFKKKCFVLKIIRLFYFVLFFSRYFIFLVFHSKEN